MANVARSPDRPTFFGTAAIVFFAYAALVLVLLHVLRPDYSPVNHMISDYGVGRFAWVMQSFFVGVSAGCAMLVIGLAQHGPPFVGARIAIVLLAVASIGLLVSAMFPTDLPGGPSTESGRVHTVSFLVNIVSLVLAAALLTASFGADKRWRPYVRSSFAMLCLIALAFALQFLTLHKGAPYGLANRFFVFALFVWMIATAFRLRALGQQG